VSRYSRANARRSIIDTVLFRLVSQASTVLGYVVLVRGMAETEFGVFNLLYAFIPIVGALASLGLEQTLRRYQPEYLQAGKQGQAHWLFRTVSLTRLVSTVMFLGIVLLCWQWVAPIFKLTPYRSVFLLFSLLVVLHFQHSIMQFSLASHMLHRYSAGAVAAWSFCKLIGYALFTWLGTLTLEKAILTDIVAYAASQLLMRIAYARHCAPAGRSAGDAPDKAEKRRLLRYGLLHNFNDSGTLALNSRVDNFYIAAFLNPLAVGIYSFYGRLNEMTRQLLPVRLFENVVSPLVFATKPEEADRRIPRYFTLLLNLNFLLHWPLLAAAAAYHAEIVQVVFGGKYLQDSLLFPLVMGMASFSVISTPATMVAQYEEKAGMILASKIFAVINVASLLLIVPLFGIYGAALSTRGFEGVKNLFIWWQVRRRARWLNAGSALLSALLVWGGAAFACLAAKRLLPLPPIGQLAIGVPILGAAMLVYLRTPALSAEDRATIVSLAGGGAGKKLLRLLGLARAEQR
jgi:O-antigen/teichoic acid export membrane protein